MTRTLPNILAAPLLLAPALAQVPDTSGFGDKVGKHYWGPIADSAFGELVVGDLDGDGMLDGVVLDAGVPMLLDTAETFLTSVHTAESGNDLALLVASSPGGPDRVLLVGPGGLTEHSLGGSPSAWTSQTLRVGPWIDMSALAVGDLDGDGGRDVIGVGGSSPALVQVLLDDGSGGYPDDDSFTTAGAAYDVAALDWTGDGRDEIAVLTSMGLGVYDREFDLVYASAWSGPPALAAVLDEPGVGQGLAVVVTNATGGLQWLMVFAQAGISGPFSLSGLGAVSVSAGDLDGDADADVALGVSSAASVFVLENLGAPGAPQFDTAGAMREVLVGDQARDPALNQASIGMGDFDRDGDLDLLIPIQGDASSPTEIPGEIPSALAVVANRGQINETPREATPTGVGFLESAESTLEIEIQLVPPTEALPFWPGESLALEVSVWHTPDLGVPTETAPHWTTEIPVSQASFVFPIDQPFVQPVTFPDIYSVVIRQVVRDAQGQPVAIGPAATAIYGSPVQRQELEALLGAGSWIEPEGDNSIDGGGVVTGPDVPPTGEGETPDD